MFIYYLHISRWMFLRYKEGIEIPEGRFDKAISGHFREPELREDREKLGFNL